MSENKEIERLRKIADKLATLDLHVKTQEEIKAEIQAMRKRAKNMSNAEIEKQFDEALIQARAQAEEAGITEEDIEGETDDRMDFIEWASLAQMIVRLH